jgi:chemotaxis protein MotB
MGKLKVIIAFSLLFIIGTSCVTQRVHDDLKTEKTEIEKRKAAYKHSLDSLKLEHTGLAEQCKLQEEEFRKMKSQVNGLQQDTSMLGTALRNIQRVHGELNVSYDRLIASNREMLSEKIQKNEALIRDLNRSRDALGEKEANLEKMDLELKAREKRLHELETILAEKDEAVANLQKMVADALLGFRDQGLTVSIQNGKVYVSMEERLLFESGSWKIDKRGREALLELAKVLRDQDDISIMVEGHTDDVPLGRSSTLADNWDLSVMRATEVTRILTQSGNIEPTRVIAAGRGEFVPVEDAKTAEARRKNRRTEIILTPNLDALFEIIEKQN